MKAEETEVQQQLQQQHLKADAQRLAFEEQGRALVRKYGTYSDKLEMEARIAERDSWPDRKGA